MSAEKLPVAAEEADEEPFALAEGHFRYYDRSATLNRAGYLTLRVVQAVIAAGITVAGAVTGIAGSNAVSRNGAVLFAVLGATTLLVETVQQLLRLHSNYLSRRQAAEEIRREMWAYALRSSGYERSTDPRRLFTERILDIASREVSTWLASMHTESRGPGDAQLQGHQLNGVAPADARSTAATAAAPLNGAAATRTEAPGAPTDRGQRWGRTPTSSRRTKE